MKSCWRRLRLHKWLYPDVPKGLPLKFSHGAVPPVPVYYGMKECQRCGKRSPAYL